MLMLRVGSTRRIRDASGERWECPCQCASLVPPSSWPCSRVIGGSGLGLKPDREERYCEVYRRIAPDGLKPTT